jgi:uncharacterized membrane protein YbhN (UPF0104 family)
MADPTNTPNRKSGRISPLRLAGTVLALGLLVYLLRQQGWDEVLNAVRGIAFWRLALAAGLMIVSRIAVAARWHVLLRAAGAPVTFGQSLRLTFAGLFATNFLPTTVGGDVVRLAGAVQLRLDGTLSTASLIVDRLVGMAGMAMVAPLGLPRFLQANVIQLPLGFDPESTGAGLAALPLGGLWKRMWEKGMKLARRLLDALAVWMKQPRSLLESLVYTWVHMLCVFGILALVYAGMGEGISFWLIAGLYSLVYLVTLLPISINGYGVQELIMTFIFSKVGGVSWAAGLTAALLFRTLMMLASVPGALFVPGILEREKAPGASS